MQTSHPLTYDSFRTVKPAFSTETGATPGGGVRDLTPPFPPDMGIPTRIRFGVGAVEELPHLCSVIKASRVALISGSHSTLQLAKQIQNHLELSRIWTVAFSAVEPEPSSSTVDAALELISETGCELVVAIGGGSAMDVAKLAALASENGGHCRDYESEISIEQQSLPVIAVPTTSGSGSEVTPYSVINSVETGRKFTVNSALLYPRYALVDRYVPGT